MLARRLCGGLARRPYGNIIADSTLKRRLLRHPSSACNDVQGISITLYPPSQKAPSGRARMNAKRVSAIALSGVERAKEDLLRRVPQKM
jgi:hypothetical protein